MAENRLNLPDVGPASQQVGRAGVAQRDWHDSPGNARSLGVLGHNDVDALGFQPTPVDCTQEKRRLSSVGSQRPSVGTRVLSNRLQSTPSNGNHPLSSSLAEPDEQFAFGHIHVVTIKIGRASCRERV